MRIGRLSLHRYGHFADWPLEFPAAPTDFHLVLGANEAGKSTTLAAITDLLFGFPTKTPYAFQHATSQLRVGGVLEGSDRTLELVRRKGTGATLEDGAGRPVPEADLPPELQGLGREGFLRAAALDHARLREGGRSMAESNGDAGQALFAAGTGLRHLPAVQRDLVDACDAIWGERRKATRTWYKAQDELDAAKKRLKDARVLPAEWASASRRVEELQGQRAALEAQRRTLEAEHMAVQRVRRLAGPVQRRGGLNALLATIAVSPFTPGETDDFRAALQTLSEAVRQTDEAIREAAALEAGLAGLSPDAPVLEQSAAIDALVLQASRVQEGMSDALPLRADLGMLDAAAARIRAALGWPDSDGETAEQVPDALTLSRLDRLAKRHDVLADRAEKATAAQRRALAALQPVATVLPETDETEDGTLALAQQAGQRAMTRQDGLAKVRRLAGQAEAALQAAMARLLPWSGDVAALEWIAVPSEAEIQAAASLLGAAEADAAVALRSAAETGAALARNILERERLELAGVAVPRDTVLEARRVRDAAWRTVRMHLVEGTQLTDPATAVERVEGAIEAADTAGDRRFAQAEASARLQNMADEAARLTLDATQAQAAGDRAAAARAAAEKAWTTRLAGAGLPAMAPERIRSWTAERRETLDAAATLATTRGALDEDETAVAAAVAGLHAVLPDTPADAALPALLDRAAAETTRRVKAATTRAARAAKRDADGQEARRAGQDLDDAVAALREVQDEWTAGVAETRLAACSLADADATLTLVRDLTTSIADARKLRQRVEGIDARRTAFELQAATVAAICGEPPRTPEATAHALAERLKRAKQVDEAQRTLAHQLARHREQAAASGRAAMAARQRLAPLAVEAGGADAPVLEAALGRIAERREAEAGLRALDREIIDMEGLPLDQALAAVEGADLFVAAATDGRLRDETAAVAAALEDLAARLSTAEMELAQLDRGAAAAGAAADIEQAEAALAAEAEVFVLRRAELVLIESAIERYRQRQQNPLLDRAATLFSALTLGRYGRLQVDRSEKKPRLIALRGEMVVDVDGMSEGTADQLFLALRLAAFEQSLASGTALPFLADDLFVNFDDARAEAGFRVLGDLAQRTQVLFFTHHEHLRSIAERALHPHVVEACRL